MPIYVKDNHREYIPAPEGLHLAVCVDAIEMGEQETPWGLKRKVQLRWQLHDKLADEKPFLVSKKYTASLHKKATLRQHIDSWRGKGLTDEEASEFDLEKLIGANCQLNINHVSFNDGGVFAAVNAIVPPPKGGKKLKADSYTRVKDRDDNPGPGPNGPHGDEPPQDDDAVPF